MGMIYSFPPSSAVSEMDYLSSQPYPPVHVFANLKNYRRTDPIPCLQFSYIVRNGANSLIVKAGGQYKILNFPNNGILTPSEIIVADRVLIAGKTQSTYGIKLTLGTDTKNKSVLVTITDQRNDATIITSGRDVTGNAISSMIDVVISVGGEDIITAPIISELNAAFDVATVGEILEAVPLLKAGDVISVRLKDAFYTSRQKNADGKYEMYLIEGEQPVATYTLTEQDIPTN